MNKQDLVKAVTESANISQSAANAAINGFINAITKALQKGDTVTLIGFGTFKVQKRAARTGVNPNTGEKIKIKARKVVRFVPGKGIKDAVAKARSKK